MYYGKRGIIFREEKRGSKVCCFTYPSIYPPSLRGETWLRIILSLFFFWGGYCLKLSSFLEASEAPSSLLSIPLCVPVVCSGCCSDCASREPAGKGRGERGWAVGRGLRAPPPSLPSRPLPGSETFPNTRCASQPSTQPQRCRLPAQDPLRWRGAKV